MTDYHDLEIDQLENRIDLESAMCCLTKRQRQAACLYALGYTYADIGGELGISSDNARQLLKRAIKNLRENSSISDSSFLPNPFPIKVKP